MQLSKVFVAGLCAVLLFASGIAVRPFLADLRSNPAPEINIRASQQADLPLSDFDIVMLGDSLTDHGRWTELLPCCTVANRGIGRDTILMLSNRLDAVPNGVIYLMIGAKTYCRARRYRLPKRNWRTCSKHLMVAKSWCSQFLAPPEKPPTN